MLDLEVRSSVTSSQSEDFSVLTLKTGHKQTAGHSPHSQGGRTTPGQAVFRAFATVILLGSVSLGCVSTARASTISCPSNPTTDPLSDFVSPSTTTGCTTVDSSYINWTLSPSAAGETITPSNGSAMTFPTTPTVTAPTASQIFLTEDATHSDLLDLSSPGPGGPGTKVADNNCGSSSGSLGWCVQGANQTLVSSVIYTAEFNNAIS